MEIKPYREFGDNHTRKEAFIVVPLVLLCVLIGIFAGGDSPTTSVLVIGVILVSIAGTVWQSRRLRRFRCPRCGRSIPEPTIKYRSENEPINYYCPDCDIEWETGLTETTAS